jgi:streptogramin lyase
MASTEKQSSHHVHPMLKLAVALIMVFSCLPSYAQKVVRGSIKGTVAADQGQVVGFRVAAHNLDQRIWYTVFTVKGQYNIPQALPGHYEIMVYEPDYDSPTSPVQLGPGENKTADFMIKKKAPANNDSKIEYVSTMDEIFPPGPGLDMLKDDCTGCHADAQSIGKNFSGMHLTKEKFLTGIEQMTETGPSNNAFALALSRTIISKSDKNMLADYLFKNFGPGTVEKRLRRDPVPVDENIAGKMIYVSYDLPADLPIVRGGDVIGAPMVDGVLPQIPKSANGQFLNGAFISPVDGDVYFPSKASNSILRLNPKDMDASERWKNYPIKGDEYVFLSGVTVDKQNRVYWAEDKTSYLGELDPTTGKQIRHALPAKAGMVNEVVVDKDGNVGFDLIYGAFFGRMEAVSRKLHMYPTPTPDNGMYGLAADQHGNLWGAGWEKGMIGKWDKDTETVKEYKVPNSWGQVRRIGVDSKGIVWASEYETGLVARLDPTTGNLTEYKLPNGAKPYDCWPDKSDNIWVPDEAHSTIAKLDPKTGKFTFYPMPQPFQSLNKLDVADDNTLWLPTRGRPFNPGVHFYPEGYSEKSPPMP